MPAPLVLAVPVFNGERFLAAALASLNAQGVFTKFDPNATLTVTLIVDGVARDTATSQSFSTEDTVVQYQFD